MAKLTDEELAQLRKYYQRESMCIIGPSEEERVVRLLDEHAAMKKRIAELEANQVCSNCDGTGGTSHESTFMRSDGKLLPCIEEGICDACGGTGKSPLETKCGICKGYKYLEGNIRCPNCKATGVEPWADKTQPKEEGP